jgi:hypothetical protein
MILFLALAGTINIARAGTPEDSLVDAQAAIIRKNLAARIQENERLIKAGKVAEASYVVSAMADQPYSVFTKFTSEAARQLWIKQSASMRFLGLDNLSSHVNNLNAWISELRKTYLDHTPYKDYKIYFVVSGIYNYKNIERKDPEYDWNKMRTINYYEQVRTNPGAYSEKEEGIIRAIISKVKNDKDNSVLKASLDKDKYIVCYLFNLYTNYSGVHTEFRAGMELSESRLIIGTTPEVHNTFIINGIYHSSSIEPSLIAELEKYNKDHQQGPPSDSGTNITTRNDYLSQLIRNVYVFFNQKAGGGLANVDCEHDEGLINRLEDLYKTSLPNATKTDISESLKDLTLETRKCLLEKLSQKTICADNAVFPFPSNLCEQLIVDVVRSTPPEQQRSLLDLFNGNNPLLRNIIVNKTDDEHELFGKSTGGENNYTELVRVLSQFAYNVYKAELSLAIAETSPCKTLTYDPQKPFNDLTNNVTAKYEDGNYFTFTFKRYTGPCSWQYFDYAGSAQYGDQVFIADPFAWVSVVPTTDLPFNFFVNGKQQDCRGKTLYVPALMLYWNIRKNTLQGIKDNLERAKTVIEVGMLFLGDGLMVLEGSKLKKLWAGINNAVTIANKATTDPELKRWLQSSPIGEKALKTLEVIGNHLSTPGDIKDQMEKGKIKPETLTTLNDIVVFWQAVLADPPAYDPKLNYAAVTSLVRGIQEGLLEEDAISTKIPLIGAAGTGTQPNPQTGTPTQTNAPCELCGDEPLMCKLEQTAKYEKSTDALLVLCARLNKALLNSVARKLAGMGVDELNTFLSDVVNNTPPGAPCYTIVNGYLAQNIPSLTVGTINAWHIYEEAGRTCLRVSQPHLTSLKNAIESDVLNGRPYNMTYPEYESITKACGAQKSQTGDVDNEIFVNLYEFAKRHYAVADFDGMKSNLMNANPYYTVVGANWVLKYMQTHEDEFKSAYNIRFESTTVYDDMGNRIADLELQRGTNRQYYEFKSYKTSSLSGSNFAEQFIKDLARPNVVTYEQLKWIFDGSKTDRNAVYKRIKEELLMDKNITQLIPDARRKALFKQLAIDAGYTHEIETVDDLSTFISGTNSKWFDKIFKVVQ